MLFIYFYLQYLKKGVDLRLKRLQDVRIVVVGIQFVEDIELELPLVQILVDMELANLMIQSKMNRKKENIVRNELINSMFEWFTWAWEGVLCIWGEEAGWGGFPAAGRSISLIIDNVLCLFKTPCSPLVPGNSPIVANEICVFNLLKKILCGVKKFNHYFWNIKELTNSSIDLWQLVNLQKGLRHILLLLLSSIWNNFDQLFSKK